jgi:hypothetical protein
MNKLIFGGILSLLISGNLPAAAQQPGQYVRKALPQPAFFVPQKDIQYQEKLPPFNLPPQPAEVKVQTTVEKVQYSEPAFQPEVISDNKEESVPDEFNPNLDITLPEVPQEKAEPQAATPKYQQEYAAYVKDLQAIEQSGQALPNQELEDDLAQMGSEQRLEVDAGGKILNPFSQAQLINPMAEAPVRDASVPKAAKKSTAQILDKVEIIRRPPQQEELSAQDNAPDNPFADRAELPAIQPAEEVPLSPEVAAHFGGLNPFAGGDAEPADVSEQADPEDTVPELEPLPLPETTEEPAESPEETEPQPQPEESQEKKSHSSRNSGYHRGRSHGSSSVATSYGPNFVR